MVKKDAALNIYKIATMVLLVISVIFNVLQKPVFNYLVITGREMQRPMPIFTFTFFLFIVETVLIGAYIFFQKNKVVSKFFSVALIVNIVSRIYSIIGLINLISTYNSYSMDMEWVKPIISQQIVNVLISTAYLVTFVFLLIDALRKHKFLKTSRIIMLIIFVIGLFSTIMNLVNNNMMYAIVSSYGFFFNLALLIYYFRIAENKNNINLERELYRLKTEYENGNITDEEYATAKQDILNNL